jgi:hypothetical protein
MGDSVLLQRGFSACIKEKGILTGFRPTWARFLHLLHRLAGSTLLLYLVASCTPSLAASLTQPVVFCSLPVDQAPSNGQADGMLPSDYGEGASLMVLQPDGATRRLTSDFASACDPDVSFDGERILFAAQRQAGDPWNIWEMHADGTKPRQITHETLDARRPIYLSTFYTITSSEPWYTILFERQDGVLNEAGTAPGTSLYTVRLDGSELRRITFHPGNDRTPFLMQDGLLLFSGWRMLSDPRFPTGRIGLYGVQTDGIDYAFFGGLQGARIQHMATLTTEGLVVFVEADQVGWDGAGSLAALRTQRPHYSYAELTDESRGLFHSPSPLEDGDLLVSQRSSDGDSTFRLGRFQPVSGDLEPLLALQGHHLLHAKLLASRPEPDGRSSTVRPESPTGKLFCLDVYESDQVAVRRAKGSIDRVRVIEAVPRAEETPADVSGSPGTNNSTLARRLLGEAPVEPDGSFHIDVPADLPVQLQLLGNDGLALATCDWIWVKNREYRGCIGCHEDPELTPENRFVQAVARPANQLTLPPERRRSVTFRQHVLPILRTRCSECHGDSGQGPAFGALADQDDAWTAYQTLLGRKSSETSESAAVVVPGSAKASRLIWQLFGRDTSQAGDEAADHLVLIAPGHVELLTDEERQVFVEWIDLGAPWDLAAESPGAGEGGAVP